MPLTRTFLTLSIMGLGVQAAAAPHVSAVLDRSSISAGRARHAVVLLGPGSASPPQQARSGAATAANGMNREWETPPLERGRTYEYVFTTKWRPNNYTLVTRKKTVQFKGGDAVVVDLTIADPADRAEIRYVPTPDHIVAEMIRVAGITRDDVVYEPGCGDARITIAAVKAGARRGVGIDLDLARVADSRKRVSAAGLDGQIEIRRGDALDIKDLSEATVVFLYMGEEFDVLLRPILLKQLRVGARVVSHRFRMGDWMPDETIPVGEPTSDDVSLVHLWTITKEVKERAAKP
jgi:uncharacterized protein (TIGR03000 family)